VVVSGLIQMESPTCLPGKFLPARTKIVSREKIIFDYPSFMMGKDVKNVKLHVADGVISEWSAEQGQDVLDKVFAIEGARKFGEVAIGTNSNITRATRNILFDEKIGGTVHMAVGTILLSMWWKKSISHPLGYDHRHAGRRENICGWKNDL
jgi:hypothetical protein